MLGGENNLNKFRELVTDLINDAEVKQDHNGLWFILNADGFPISNAYENEYEAKAELRRITQYA